MRTHTIISLLVVVSLVMLACGIGQPQNSTIEVTRLVQEAHEITVEVTRLVPKRKVVTVEVTRIVRETVVVLPTPAPEPALSITPGITLIVARTWHTMTPLLDQRILLVGGSDGDDAHLAEVEIYEPLSGSLVQAAFLHAPRHEHTATLLMDNRVLVVGGYNALQGWLSDAEVYDPATNTWTIIPPLYPHGVQHTATRLNDGRVLVIGGCYGGGLCTSRVEIFDPQTNSWSEAPPLGSERASHTATLLNDGRVLVAGGWKANGGALLYNPQANRWAPTGPMIQPVVQAAAIKLPDGRVLVSGGYATSDQPIISAHSEIYDPVTNSWTAAAPLSQPRYAFLLTRLQNGQVLALGGAREYDYPGSKPWTEASFVRAIERYAPNLDRWAIIGELPRPVAYAAIAFLPDGRLWMTGGNADTGAWADTWLISPLPELPE